MAVAYNSGYSAKSSQRDVAIAIPSVVISIIATIAVAISCASKQILGCYNA